MKRLASILFALLVAAALGPSAWARHARGATAATVMLADCPGSANPCWTLQSTGTGFQWLSPTGTTMPKYAAVSQVDTLYLKPSVLSSKYGNNVTTWAAAQDGRLKSYGFNAAGQYSYAYGLHGPGNALPSVITISADAYASANTRTIDGPYSTSMVCHSSLGASNEQIDPYDPTLPSNYATVIPFQMTNSGQTPVLPHAIAIMTTDGDTPSFLNNYLTHGDAGYIMASHYPSLAPPSGTDFTVYAKTAMRDYLLNEYLCTAAGSPVSTCTGVGIGTGSADPSSGSYVGSTNANSALTALNTAWTTSYTTWNTSDAGGLAGIKSGSYSSASYTAGTGFLDENGRNVLPASPPCNNLFTFDTWAKNATIESDTHLFIAAFATQWATQLLTGWQSAFPTAHPPFLVPLYDPPTFVAAAVGAVLKNASFTSGNAANILWTSPGAGGNVAAAPNLYTHTQAIIAAAPGMPLIVANYMSSAPDSAGPASQIGSACPIGQCFTTKALQVSGVCSTQCGMVPLWTNTIHLQDANSKYVVVGLEHWSWYDECSGCSTATTPTDNLGFVTIYDNPYDQSATLSASSGAWAASHAYTAPVIISDGTNFEALSNALASCTSGASAPTWSTQNGSLTADGSCEWRNEGSGTLATEVTPLVNSASATYPAAGYGDVISPLATFLNAGLADP